MQIRAIRIHGNEPPVVVVLGTGDIASAIGRALFQAGWGVILLRDAAAPVLRRAMAFDDALEEGVAELDGVWGVRAPAVDALPALTLAREAVVVANLDLAVFVSACHGLAGVLVDSRMRKYAPPADLRPLVACAVGIGPGFVAGGNVDVAIETLPGEEGEIVTRGATAAATGRAVPLGGAGAERFVTAPAAGAWLPRAALGGWVVAGTAIGTLGRDTVTAPIDGCVRGMVRATPGGVARGAKLVEIDPRPDAPWSGVPPRARRIATGVRGAVAGLMPARADHPFSGVVFPA